MEQILKDLVSKDVSLFISGGHVWKGELVSVGDGEDGVVELLKKTISIPRGESDRKVILVTRFKTETRYVEGVMFDDEPTEKEALLDD